MISSTLTTSTIDEKEWLAQLTEMTVGARIAQNPETVINVYVALKSKPLMILAGLPDSGKTAFIRCLAQFLYSGDCYQCQILAGHPWWVTSDQNVALFAHMHSRFTSEKLLSLLEDASLQENQQRLYLAGLIKICAGELQNFFTEVSFQLQRGEVMHFGDLHLAVPIPFPTNLRLLGTMDIRNFSWWDPDLLTSTTVIHWKEEIGGEPFCPLYRPSRPVYGEAFLASSIISEQAVYQKLYAILGRFSQPFACLFSVKNLFKRYQIPFSEQATKDVMTFLANSWSAKHAGLFDDSVRSNLKIAFDFALAQYLLPRVKAQLNLHQDFRQSLEELLKQNYPYSHNQLRWICDE